MARRESMGSKCYVFEDDTGIPAHEVVISAHGGYWVGLSGTFRVPHWTTLHFLSPHKTTLSDPTIHRVMGGVPTYEVYNPGDVVRDYQLSKYQGRHNQMDETYASIEEDIDVNRQNIAFAAEAEDDERAQALSSGIELRKLDVLTIRNRRLKSSPSLSEVIHNMDKDGRRYPKIICLICRSPILLPSQTYKV